MTSIKQIKTKHTNIVKYINNTFTLSYHKINDDEYKCVITNTNNNKSLDYIYRHSCYEPTILSVFVDILTQLDLTISLLPQFDTFEEIDLLHQFKDLIDANDYSIIQQYYKAYDDYLHLFRKGKFLYEE